MKCSRKWLLQDFIRDCSTCYLARRGRQLSVKYEVSFAWKGAKDINAVRFVTGFLSENIISHSIPFSCFGLKQFSFRNRDLGNVGSSVIQPPSIPPFLIRGSDYNDSS